MHIRSAFHSRIYHDYLAIEPNDYQRLIRFYKNEEGQINELEKTEQYELFLSYANALFQIGAYQRFLLIADQAIRVTLDEEFSISFSKKQDLFEDLLFQKSAACIHTHDTQQAQHVLKELLKINPTYGYAQQLLRQTLMKEDIRLTFHTRAVAIVAFAISGFIIAIELLMIRPFYEIYVNEVELARNLIFFLGILVLGIGELITYWRACIATNACIKRGE